MNGLAGLAFVLGAPKPLLGGANGFVFALPVCGAPNDEKGPPEFVVSAPNAGAEPNGRGDAAL